jgi:hypothetical protein
MKVHRQLVGPRARRVLASLRRATAQKRSPLVVLAPTILLALAASAWVTTKTVTHVGQGYDSGSYIGMAKEIRSGHGPRVPFTDVWDAYPPRTAVGFGSHVPSSHFPPGYPIAIAAVSVGTANARSATRAIAVLTIFVNVLLIGVVTARLTSYRSALVAAIPAALLLFVPDTGPAGLLGVPVGWLGMHLGIYSEPLLTALATGALLATQTAVTEPSFRTRRALRAIAMATMLAAGALLARYVGIAVVLAVGLALALRGKYRRFRTRVAAGIGLVSAAVVPTALFLLWNSAQGGGGARILTFHPAPDNRELFRTSGVFFLPLGWPTWAREAGLLLLAVVVVLAAIPLGTRLYSIWGNNARPRALYQIGLMFIGVYLAVVLLTRTFFDIQTPLDPRILAPVRGIAYALVVGLAFRLLARHLRVTVIVVVLGGLSAGLIWSDWTSERFVLDYGAGPRPRRTTTEVALASLPKRAVIVSNAAPLLYLRTGRSSFNLPERVVYVTGESNDVFDRDMKQWGSILTERKSYAYFITPWVPTSATVADLEQHVGLRLISRTDNERLYEVVRPSA